MSYRDIIKVHVQEAVKRKSQTTDPQEVAYWEWVLGQLMGDLGDFETNGQERWAVEPFDGAWQKYRRSVGVFNVSPIMNLDEFLRRFFEGPW